MFGVLYLQSIVCLQFTGPPLNVYCTVISRINTYRNLNTILGPRTKILVNKTVYFQVTFKYLSYMSERFSEILQDKAISTDFSSFHRH